MESRDVLDLDPEEIKLWAKGLRDKSIIKFKGQLVSQVPLEWTEIPEFSVLVLRTVDTTNPSAIRPCIKRGYGYCVVGVAGKTLFGMTDEELKTEMTNVPQLKGRWTNVIIKLNDSSNLTLPQLADFLEALYERREEAEEWYTQIFKDSDVFHNNEGNPYSYEMHLRDLVKKFTGISVYVKMPR